MPELEKCVITASEGRVQDLYRETILTCPVSPLSLEITLLRNGINLPSTRRNDEIGLYMRECYEKGVAPFSRMSITSHGGKIGFPDIGKADWNEYGRFTNVEVDKLPKDIVVGAIYYPLIRGEKPHCIDYKLSKIDDLDKFNPLTQFKEIFLPLHERDRIRNGKMLFDEKPKEKEVRPEYIYDKVHPGVEILIGQKYEPHPEGGLVLVKNNGIEVRLHGASCEDNWKDCNRRKIINWVDQLNAKYAEQISITGNFHRADIYPPFAEIDPITGFGYVPTKRIKT